MNVKLESGTPQEAGMSPQRVQHIVNLAAGWVEQGITPALIVLAARKGVVFLHEAFGHMGPEQDAPPLELDAIYPLGSLTKPVTATATMILVEDGLLGLNRPVQWYLPEFVGEGKEGVMDHHLLTHTSGVRDEETKFFDLNAFAEKKRELSLPPCDETQHPLIHENLSLRYDVPLWKPPGTEMSYSSYGYELLGEIVRRVSGRSLAGFCRERIFQPLGMVDTHFVVPDSAKHRIVRRSKDAPWADLLEPPLETPWACGGAYATAMDMASFGQMFLNRGTYGEARILSPASVAEMTRNQIPGISARLGDQFFPEASWGFGWSVHGHKKSVAYGEPLQSSQAFVHGGAGGVFLWMDPTYEIVGAYFAVASHGGTPAWILVSEQFGDVELMGRADLLVNAVTAAIVDL